MGSAASTPSRSTPSSPGWARYVGGSGGGGRAGVIVSGPRLAALLAARPALAQPYSEVRPPTPQLHEAPYAALLPRVGAGILARSNPAGDADPAPPAPAT